MRRGFVIDSRTELAGLDGYTLTWLGFMGFEEDHDRLLLHGICPFGTTDPVLLTIARLRYIDCPMTMTDVRLGAGMETDVESYIPPGLKEKAHVYRRGNQDGIEHPEYCPWDLQNGLLSVKCDQGVFFILAGFMKIDRYSTDAQSNIVSDIPVRSLPAAAVYDTQFVRFDQMVEVSLDAPLWFGGAAFSEL